MAGAHSRIRCQGRHSHIQETFPSLPPRLFDVHVPELSTSLLGAPVRDPGLGCESSRSGKAMHKNQQEKEGAEGSGKGKKRDQMVAGEGNGMGSLELPGNFPFLLLQDLFLVTQGAARGNNPQNYPTAALSHSRPSAIPDLQFSISDPEPPISAPSCSRGQFQATKQLCLRMNAPPSPHRWLSFVQNEAEICIFHPFPTFTMGSLGGAHSGTILPCILHVP